jgi:uracil-DNA glycosylase family 4
MDYKCTDCDLYKDSCAGTKKQFQLNKIEGKGTIKAKIMVVGTYPGASECESGIPFTGTTGVTLKKALTSAGITEEEVYFTYLVKCRTPRTKKSGERLKERDPLKKERTACLAHFKKEVEEINPNVIIMLGNVVTDTLIQKKGITSIHGTPYWSEDFLATCIPVYSPDYIKRPYADTSDEVNFIADLKFAKESSEKNEFKAKEKQETNYIFCDTLVKVRGLIKRLKTLDEYAFDIESTGLDPRNSELLGIAFSWKEGTGVYVPFNLWFQYYDEENYEEMRKDMEQVITTYVPEGKKLKKKKDDGTVFYELEDFWDNFEYAEIMKTLVPLIVNKEIRKIGHNIAFDVGYLNLKWDVDIQNASYCTMLAEYLPDPESMASRSLEALAWKYTDMGGYDDGLKGERKVGFRNTPVEDLAMYGCGDVDATFRIYLVQGAIIEPFLDLLQNILVPLSIAIREMEYNGMKVDVDRIKTLAVEYEAKIIDHETKLLTLKDVEDFVQTYLDAQKKDIKRKWLNSETLMKNHTKKE